MHKKFVNLYDELLVYYLYNEFMYCQNQSKKIIKIFITYIYIVHSVTTLPLLKYANLSEA